MGIERKDQLRYLRDAVRGGQTADQAMEAVAEAAFISAVKFGGIYEVTKWRKWFEDRGKSPPNPSKPRQ